MKSGAHIYHSAEKKVIPAQGKALIDTQLSIAVPPGTYGRVAPRSGLGKGHQTGPLSFPVAYKFFSHEVQHPHRGWRCRRRLPWSLIHFALQPWRQGFRESVRLSIFTTLLIRLLFFSVNEGDRVAQLIIERIYTPEISVVEVRQLLSQFVLLNDPFVGLGRDLTWQQRVRFHRWTQRSLIVICSGHFAWILGYSGAIDLRIASEA